MKLKKHIDSLTGKLCICKNTEPLRIYPYLVENAGVDIPSPALFASYSNSIVIYNNTTFNPDRSISFSSFINHDLCLHPFVLLETYKFNTHKNLYWTMGDLDGSEETDSKPSPANISGMPPGPGSHPNARPSKIKP
jgi:hypothetical protein